MHNVPGWIKGWYLRKLNAADRRSFVQLYAWLQINTELILHDRSWYPNDERILTIMAKRRVEEPIRDFYKGRLTWVDITLRPEDKEELEKWSKATKVLPLLLATLEDGYQLQTSWDYKSDSFLTVLKQNYTGHPDSGYAMSSRSRDHQELVCMTLYKFHVLMGGSLAGGETPTSLGWG